MSSIEEPLMAGEESLDSYLASQDDHIGIFTHAAATRIIAIAIFAFYVYFFYLFIDVIRDRFQYFQEPDALLALNDPATARLLFYIVGAVGLLLALVILIYLAWTVVDIWGLQVWLSASEIRVQNTITGPYLRRWTGVGVAQMDDIKLLKGGKLATYVATDRERLRFSPVDKVDVLVAAIVKNAKNLRIEDPS